MKTGQIRSTFGRGGLAVLAAVLLAACSPAEQGGDAQADQAARPPAEVLREALLDARPGAVIDIPAGRFTFDRSLSLAVDGVTLRGAGSGRSVLSFAGQRAGAEGLLVTADDVTLQGFAIEDAKGDAVKVNECRNLVIRDVRTEWTNGPSPDNGAYGIYPVQCTGVLIEDSTAIGASDAGIYVGQSFDIVVRNNRVEFNVAGIEIENSRRADVHGNDVTNNTGGILVFDLPGLPVQGGRETRVFANRVYGNNTANFAPPGNIVGTVPAGSGIMINANDDIEVFGNEIDDHATAAIMVVSYLITGRPVEDPAYDPYPEGIHIHHNMIGRSGYAPDSEPLVVLHESLGGADIPSVIWDGFVAPDAVDPVLCLHDNQGASIAVLDAPNGFAEVRFDPPEMVCELAALAAVSLPTAPGAGP
ncbi:MAG TPA: parallel beta-helix domain-containing protein [Pseudomonadales bacterium]|nr:parallel beta-helix domain-containing protein [Pseudomonadales bacterium]